MNNVLFSAILGLRENQTLHVVHRFATGLVQRYTIINYNQNTQIIRLIDPADPTMVLEYGILELFHVLNTRILSITKTYYPSGRIRRLK
jgi:hypothetical protein